MIEIENYKKFKFLGKEKNKTKIILCHTSRGVEEYLTSLNFRYNSKYDKIPNFLISKEGQIIKLLNGNEFSNFFYEDKLNRTSIIITLENLGWLAKKPLSTEYINWNGSIYTGEVFKKKWRDLYFWDPYTESQINSLLDLCLEMTDSFKINKRFIGNNSVISGIENYNGIICRSNLSSFNTDLNPSFNYNDFKLKIENE
jgi:N-acetyl-anhydromuramyl-L-alanine amidase AmpD